MDVAADIDRRRRTIAALARLSRSQDPEPDRRGTPVAGEPTHVRILAADESPAGSSD